MESIQLHRQQLSGQLLHWELAIDRLSELDEIASPEGWSRLERETGAVLRSSISKSIRELKQEAANVRRTIDKKPLAEVTRGIHNVRRDYLRTETMLDFFADAINSRSSEGTGRLLRGLDRIATDGMKQVLEPLGHSPPPVITYIDKGLGASILKAGLRLWDRRSINPAASVKVVRHNVLTATSILHEIGHQCGFQTAWNDELRTALRSGLPRALGKIWSSWSSEIAADAIAFVFAGHASLAALRNVVDGGRSRVFRFIPGDPHPIGMVRVLMVSAFCKQTMGKDKRSGFYAPDKQPWLMLEQSWREKYPLNGAGRMVGKVIHYSIPLLPNIADIVLKQEYKALGGKALTQLIDPRHVSPAALTRFEHEAGPRAFELPYIVKSDPIRLLALSGLRIATNPDKGREYYLKQHRALQVLGEQQLAA
ncbi:MAG: hypothetical protein OEM76_04580 [Gammaproteobacteria bacterium]|nr:hypothetical protein [Gammaproteobacteria bacterium]